MKVSPGFLEKWRVHGPRLLLLLHMRATFARRGNFFQDGPLRASSSQPCTMSAEQLAAKGSISAKGHDSTQTPFMMASHSGDTPSSAERQEVERILMSAPLPSDLKCLYRHVGAHERECVFGSWTLRSLHAVLKGHASLKEEHGQCDVVDFAISYAGMGWCVVCGYCPSLDMIFYRMDGGANGYEREDNFAKLVGYRPSLSHEGSHFFPVEHWLKEVNDHICSPSDEYDARSRVRLSDWSAYPPSSSDPSRAQSV